MYSFSKCVANFIKYFHNSIHQCEYNYHLNNKLSVKYHLNNNYIYIKIRFYPKVLLILCNTFII